MFRFQNLIPCILNFDECISKFYLFDISREQDNGREQEMLDPSIQMALARERDIGALQNVLLPLLASPGALFVMVRCYSHAYTMF